MGDGSMNEEQDESPVAGMPKVLYLGTMLAAQRRRIAALERDLARVQEERDDWKRRTRWHNEVRRATLRRAEQAERELTEARAENERLVSQHRSPVYSKPWSFEVCKDCDRKNHVGFRVSDRMWQSVMDDEQGVLCIDCFDSRATAKGIDWTIEPVDFFPVSTIANQKWGEIEASEPQRPNDYDALLQVLRELLVRLLIFLEAVTRDGNSGPIIEHTQLHKLHDIHLPDYQCEACELAKEIRAMLAAGA